MKIQALPENRKSFLTSELPWAADPLAIDGGSLEKAERWLPVATIATRGPRTCDIYDSLESALTRSELLTFDHVPVRDGDRTVGLLHMAALRQAGATERDRRVRDKMDPLTDSNLMSADAGILAFVATADSSPCRLLVDGDRVDAIVTLSDLQKLPVRPAVFLLITHLELLMARFIRANWHDSSDWLSLLTDGRREQIERNWNELEKNELAIDKIAVTQFCDKRTIILGAGKLLPNNVTVKEAEKALKAIESLRNSIAHAGDYAATRENAMSMAQTTRLARKWIDWIRDRLDRLN